MLPLLSALSLCLTAAAATPSDVLAAPEIVWAGVDYTQARFIGNEDFRDEAAVVGEYPDKWNDLVLAELMDSMHKAFGKTVITDSSHMAEHNDACSTDQVLRQEGGLDDTLIDDSALARLVGSYQLDHDQGVGFAIVVDRFVKSDQQGCSWPVFFDVQSREILYTKRVCEDAAGFGFRNYWFRPVKTIITDDLKRILKDIKKGR